MIYTGIVDVFNGEYGSFIPCQGIRVCFKKGDGDFVIETGMELKFDCDSFGIAANKKCEIVWVNKLEKL